MKVQKTMLGYDYDTIVKRMRPVKTMGGWTVNEVIMNHGMFLRTCRVKILSPTTLELNNCFGTCPVYITKDDK